MCDRKTITRGIIAGAMALLLAACGSDDGVDGTGLGGSEPVVSEDLKIIQGCLAKAPTDECAASDLNSDGYINFSDLALMKSVSQFDLNQDGLVDTRNADDNEDLAAVNACVMAYTEGCDSADFNNDKIVDDVDLNLFDTAAQFDLNNDETVDLRDLEDIVVEYSEDLAILLDCRFDAPVDDCAESDLTGDGIIDTADTDAFVDADKYDLNRDGMIDLTNDIDSNTADIVVNEDLKIIRDCFLKYTSEFPECEIADFSGDGLVNVLDLARFKSSMVFDLNHDGYVDLRVTIETQDLFLIKVCFIQEAVDDCIAPDFNNDGFINILDLAEFKRAMKFDVTGDEVIDLYGEEPGSDIDTIKSCVDKEAMGACADSDFDGDGWINAADLAEFKLSEKYDLNLDGFVDFRIKNALDSQDLAFMKGCFFKQAEGDCARADINEDGWINFVDLGQLKAAEKVDLNGDSFIDLHDTETNADLNFIRDCYLQSTDACLAADFNDDNIVNAEDLALFKATEKFDFNGDLIVDSPVEPQ